MRTLGIDPDEELESEFTPLSSEGEPLQLMQEGKQQLQLGQKIIVRGWVRSIRLQKTHAFVMVNDGSTLSHLQVLMAPHLAKQLTVGSMIICQGTYEESPREPTADPMTFFDYHATSVDIISLCDPSYPMQKKYQSLEFLREHISLRSRTQVIGSVLRIRSSLVEIINKFFEAEAFYQVQAPLLTPSDCEGAGETFTVTKPGDPEFFGRPMHLTVSSQLYLEMFAASMGLVALDSLLKSDLTTFFFFSHSVEFGPCPKASEPSSRRPPATLPSSP